MKTTQSFAISEWTSNAHAVAAIGGDRALYIRSVSRGNAVDVAPAARPPLDWISLGGSHATPPAMCSWAPGRLDVFGVGQDRAMYHRWWQDGTWEPLGSWRRLGGEFLSSPIAVASGPGHLDVFGIGRDHALWHKSWDGSTWRPGGTDWLSRGGWFPSQPAVVSLGRGDLLVCGIGRDGGAYHASRIAARWTPLTSVGGAFTSTPALISRPDLDLAAILGTGEDDDLFSMQLRGTGGGMKPLTGRWHHLGGVFNSPPTAVSLDDRTAMLLGLGRNSATWYRTYEWTSPSTPPDVAWSSIGGRCTSTPLAGRTSADNGDVRRVDVFALGVDTGVWSKAWARDGWGGSGEAGWDPPGGWRTLGGEFQFSTPVDQQAPPDADSGTGPGGGGSTPPPTQTRSLTLDLLDQAADLDIVANTWFLFKVELGAVSATSTYDGIRVTIPGLATGDYHVRAEAIVRHRVDGSTTDVLFTGNGANIGGAPSHFFSYSGGAVQYRYALRLNGATPEINVLG